MWWQQVDSLFTLQCFWWNQSASVSQEWWAHESNLKWQLTVRRQLANLPSCRPTAEKNRGWQCVAFAPYHGCSLWNQTVSKNSVKSCKLNCALNIPLLQVGGYIPMCWLLKTLQGPNFKFQIYVFNNWHRCCWEQVSYLSGTLRLNLLWPYYTIQMSQANRRRDGILSMVIQFASLMLLGIWSLWWTHRLLKNWLAQRVYMYIRDRFYSLYIHTHTHVYLYTYIYK